MAKKITQLTALSEAASTDKIPIVDASTGVTKYIQVSDLVGNVDFGWIAAGESWSYDSATTITVPTDATTKYDEGFVIRFSQSTGGTKYAVITNVAATVLTIRMLNDATLENEAISSPVYSISNPLGAGLKPSESLLSTVAFRATSTQVIPSSSVTTIDTYTEDFDLGGNFSSGVFTAPYDGIYHFDLVLGIDNVDADGRIEGRINKNNDATIIGFGFGVSRAGTYDPSANSSVTVELSAGDTIYARCYRQNSGGNSLSSNTSLSGYLVGLL